MIKNSKFQIPNSKFKKGFTLMETMIVVAILIVVIFLVAQIFIGQSAFFQKQTAQVDVALNNNRALNDLTAQIREAIEVSASSTLGGVIYSSGSQGIVLKLFSIDSQKNIINSSFDYAVYYLDSTKLIKKVFAATGSSRPTVFKTLDEHVSNFLLVYDSADFNQVKNVTASLSSLQILGGNNFAASSTIQAKLRNK